MSVLPVRACVLSLTSLLALAGGVTLAQTMPAAAVSSLVYPGDPRPDAPALSPRGPYMVGVRTLAMVRRDVPDIARAAVMSPAPNPLPRYDRPLTVEVWYPATLAPGQVQSTQYRDALGSGPGDPKRPVVPFTFPGRATRDATPNANGGKYPLVILSHGYPGSRYLMSYLAENLASKGYVVASIDHTDSTHADKAAFASTLLNRAQDDQAVLDGIAALSTSPDSFLNKLVDANNTAVIGYSMGGYGALNFAGAGFADQVLGLVPGGALAARQNGAFTVDPRLKAVVAFAPWGGDAAVRAIGLNNAAEFGFWNAAGLSAIKVPTLFIVGSQDDVSGYERGVKALFENAVNADRYLLVYQNARHNVAPNPPPVASLGNPDEYGHYAEPVWDMQRLNNLNEHFVTAFLNYYLKGQQDAAAYLNVPTPIAQNGVYSRNPDGTPKADDTFWKGFPARTAVGIELYHLKPR
ncbi:dienelactone hydrolase-like protein [Deinococcus geothermalis DSM 11300]|uniref:Dienelactone hydrolase-like protein n=1 Tax=Deinococcus geothermalis (strain DSM 11300 / CIP 105573 / AG-3a) TaxID=319795 RepID=Q1IX13_DEIGD|nr:MULTISPECIES: alpha/beta fold hydrolase [Deinococcus]ABF46221.1 dienelactone hydrolase-like protein [Deinococcus geothermalis DSM 11300]MBI0444683.1 dienelactone hydrolase [Deinococcus sp. DB0503]